MTPHDSENVRDQRILILAPTGRDGHLTARFLRDDGLYAEVCERIEELCGALLEGAGLVFLTGEALTPRAVQCLVEVLAQQPNWSDIPLVVLISGGGTSPANAGALATLGEAANMTLIERPVRVQTLLSTLKAALRARRRQYQVRDHLAQEELSKDALRQSEERLRDALESEREARSMAEEASRLKDEFLATVSHELRTPLTAVLGWTHLLRGGRLDEQARAHALDTVERNARSQNQLIEDLLDVSRIITGKLRLEVRAVSPADIIDAAVEAVLPAAEAKEIQLQKVLDTGVGAVSGDPSRLQQVVWNLLSNAIKFTPKGGRVDVGLKRAGSHIEISVSDTGDGIRAEFLPFVFDRFRQADGSTRRQYGGLGLGLSIVRNLVELHGGSVSADSAGEGAGATFKVRLPLMPVYRRREGDVEDDDAERAQNAAASDAHRLVEYPDRLDGLKILVVDDEQDTLELIKELLIQCGAEVFTATSSAEALELLRVVTPGVIVSDIGMPGEDGFEFIRKVRGLAPELGGRIPAVALTAYARAEDRLRVLRSGYQMHVAKPVELAELVAIVSNVVGRP